MQRRVLGAGVWRVLTALALTAAVMLVVTVCPDEARAVRFGGDPPPLYDRTLKCDQLERLSEPPELVIFGGSRAQRFEPSAAEALTGLSAFNFAVQNCRPEDAYAISRYLFWRAPEVKLRLVWALQVTTLADTPLHPGLLAEERLTQFLPDDFVAAQRRLDADVAAHEVLWSDEYSPRGCVLHNGYDSKEQRGISFETSLAAYLARMLPRAAAASPYRQTRAKRYFERTLQLFNLHGVEPVLVIMPYHPVALAAFREVGWQAKADAFEAYLRGLQDEYDFHLLDYTEIESFGGTADGFYDGSHVKSVNARRILAQAVVDAPAGLR